MSVQKNYYSPEFRSQAISLVRDANVKVALNAFKLEYDTIPGDFNRAQAYWPAATNGDGNKRIIGHTTEALYAWDHLEYAELFPGSFSGVSAGSPATVAGVNIPASSFGNNVSVNFGYLGAGSSCHHAGSNPLFGVKSNVNILLVGGSRASDGCPNQSFLKVSEASGMDTKIDDGLADSGFLFTLNHEGTNNDGDRCVDKHPPGTGGANYDFNETGENCRLIFILD